MTVPALRTAVPEGVSGRWRIERFTVPQPDPDATDARPTWARDEPGVYTMLVRDDELFMSDLYVELHTQSPAIERARATGGRILITGLGLGLVVEAILAEPRPPIDEIVVVEQSADVAALVGPYLSERYGALVRVVVADAFDYVPEPGSRFTVGWHDIWPSPQDPVAVDESHELVDRFADSCDWQGSWALVFLDAVTSD